MSKTGKSRYSFRDKFAGNVGADFRDAVDIEEACRAIKRRKIKEKMEASAGRSQKKVTLSDNGWLNAWLKKPD